MSAESTLRLAVESLAELGIPYMVTGSLASAFYGEPRSTQDVDVVVSADEPRLRRLAQRLRNAGLYCDEGAVSEAVSLKGMFNAVDPATGWKIDFSVLKDTAFGQAAFEDRSVSVLGGVPPYIERWVTQLGLRAEWDQALALERQNKER